MTMRIFFVVFLLFSVLLTGSFTPFRSSAAELSRSQKAELLDKAQAALIWFYTLGDEMVMNRIPAQKYREQIAPIELIQAAALLHSYREAEQTSLAEKLLLILPYYKLTPEEMFEIYDLLGDTDLPDLAEIQTSDLGRISVEANRFRTESLNNAEKVVLLQEPATALELFKAVDVLSVVGRPVLVRHYLRKFLRGGQYAASPEESAKIVETIGTQKLMQLSISPDFVPLGKEAVAKIIDEAKKHWQDDAKIAEALKETNWFTTKAGDTKAGNDTKAGMERSAMTVQIRPEAKPALNVLWKGDHLSVQQVFDKLATIEDEKEADQLTAILLSLRQDMKEALAAVLVFNSRPEEGFYASSNLRYYAARGLAASVTPQESFLLYEFLFYRKQFGEELSAAEREKAEQEEKLFDAKRASVRNILQQRRIAVPSQEQAAKILFDRAMDYFEHRRPLRTDADGNVSFWAWVPEGEGKGKILYYSVPDVETAYKRFAHVYYLQCVKVVPPKSAKRELYGLYNNIAYFEYVGHYVAVYGFDSLNVGLGQTHIISIDDSDGELFIRTSLERNCFYAAKTAIKSIQVIGQEDFSNVVSSNICPYSLKSTNGKPRTLVQATVSTNRSVRFAALETIMNLTLPGTAQSTAPSPALLSPFAGSSHVADTLVWFSKSEGQKVILSGHPQKASAIQTANLFLGLGYKTDIATTCRELFERAAASPDVEAVFVDVRTGQPPVGEFVQMMRQDARTAEIPIAILSDSPGGGAPPLLRRTTMTQFDRRSPDNPFRTSLSLTYPRLADEKSAQWVLNDLLDKTGSKTAEDKERGGVSPPVRLEQAKQALGWLREIKLAELETGQKIYHFDDFDSVVLDALHSEVRVHEGLLLAAVVKSAALQSAMYEMAANAVYPMPLRTEAGGAFEESVERFGILLRGVQIQRLYDRYNQSESEPKESQELLGRLIDAVEAQKNNSPPR